MILFALWLFTSAYSTKIAIFPSAETCYIAGSQLKTSLDKPPRALMAVLACIPTIAIAPAAATAPHPEFGAAL